MDLQVVQLCSSIEAILWHEIYYHHGMIVLEDSMFMKWKPWQILKCIMDANQPTNFVSENEVLVCYIQTRNMHKNHQKLTERCSIWVY